MAFLKKQLIKKTSFKNRNTILHSSLQVRSELLLTYDLARKRQFTYNIYKADLLEHSSEMQIEDFEWGIHFLVTLFGS